MEQEKEIIKDEPELSGESQPNETQETKAQSSDLTLESVSLLIDQKLGVFLKNFTPTEPVEQEQEQEQEQEKEVNYEW